MARKQSNPADEEPMASADVSIPKLALVRSRTNSSDALSIAQTLVPEPCYDVEHVPAEDDPRSWSKARKVAISTLVLVSLASMIATLCSTVQNPAFDQVETDLRDTAGQFSLDISTFILIQGAVSLLWNTIYELKGSRFVYVVSLVLFTLANVFLALTRHIGAVIGLRSLQAAGSSAVVAIGPATIADIFEAEERGEMMGIYNIAILLGPALGPIVGGAFSSIWTWRTIFWSLALGSGLLSLISIFLLRNTSAPTRSLTSQHSVEQPPADMAQASSPRQKEAFKEFKYANQSDITVVAEKSFINRAKGFQSKQRSFPSLSQIQIRRAPTDVNPLKLLFLVIERKSNLLVLTSSGLFFAYGFLIHYATARTLGESFDYDPIRIGLVISLAYGSGCLLGGVFGGRWSDRELRRFRVAKPDQNYPEFRLKSTILCACIFPLSVAGFGWLSQELSHVSLIVVKLSIGGILNNWIFSITMAYIIDANPGRSSTAAAAASAFRGVLAFIAAETVVPIQDHLGNGWLFTIWSGVLVLATSCILIVWLKGAKWREADDLRAKEEERTFVLPSTPLTGNTLV